MITNGFFVKVSDEIISLFKTRHYFITHI